MKVRQDQTLRVEWLAILQAELVRRGEEEGDDETVREQLFAELDQMAERIRAAPDYVEPSAAEKARRVAELDAWFAARERRS